MHILRHLRPHFADLIGLCAAMVMTACTMGAVPMSASNVRSQVIDGDTLRVNGTVYRLNGIDAPEAGQTCRAGGRIWSCGGAATLVLGQLIDQKHLQCKTHETDRYGRSVATCYADGADIGREMVRRGMAWAYVKYDRVYVGEERSARQAADGVWAGTALAPWDYRAQNRGFSAQSTQIPPSPDCAIKGNISGNGRIYHLPGSRDYARTSIDPRQGERWFCTTVEARAAGWRAPRG